VGVLHLPALRPPDRRQDGRLTVTVLAVGEDEASWSRLPERLADDVVLRPLVLPRERTPRRAAEGLLPAIGAAPRPRVLLGHDRGGSVAIELAQFAAAVLDGLILHSPRGARRFRFLEKRPALAREWQSSLRPVALPAAILWGEKDRVLPVEGAEAFRPLLPGALVSLPGRWGHHPMVDDPSGYAREICALVRAIVGERSRRSAPTPC
jgi:pimeloyl-ACP methyl ester carboxylesterase